MNIRGKFPCKAGAVRLFTLFPAFCAGLLFLYACDFPQGMGSGGSGLTVHLSRAGVTGASSSRTGLSRSVLSDSDIGSLEYKVTFTDPGGTFIERTVRGGSVSVALDPGDWKIDAKAYAPPRSNWRQSGGK